MTEDIEHLDFEPEDPKLRAALEAARRVLEDPRDYKEAMGDEIDEQLFNMMYHKGIIEASNTDSFSREDLINSMHDAYFQGMRDLMEHPEVAAKILKAAAKSGPGLKSLSSSTEA